MDATKKFDGRAADYTVGRPGYAQELIDHIYQNCGIPKEAAFADIGSGTGKFSKYLLDRGSVVYCVEPNPDMRKTAEAELAIYPNFHSVPGNAEETTLEAESVDCITVAQAFHWFDVEKFRSECRRIIRKDGPIFLIWNSRNTDDPLNQELYAINAECCPAFKGFNGGIKKDDERIREFFYGRYEYAAFDNPLHLDRTRFIARSLSSSYSLKEGDDGYGPYLQKLNDLFDKYENDGMVLIPNKSAAYIGRV